MINAATTNSEAHIWHTSHLILVQIILHSGTGWHHPFVPESIVSCIFAVIVWVVAFPYADVHAWLQKQFELKLVFLAARHSRRVGTIVDGEQTKACKQDLPQATFILLHVHYDSQRICASGEPVSLDSTVLQHLLVLLKQAWFSHVSVRQRLLKVLLCSLYSVCVPAARPIVSHQATEELVKLKKAWRTYAGGTEGIS